VRKIEKHAIAVNSTSGLRSVPNPKKTARALQRMGTKGDTVLAHINPREATLLDMLADGKLDGGGRNPRTGLRSYGNNDGESGRNDGRAGGPDGNPGGVGGGPVGGQTGGGIGGNTSQGLGGLGGGYGGVGETDRGQVQSAGMPDNPEMGGGRVRAQGLAAAGALGPTGRNVNAASSVMAGRPVGMTDRFNDFVGANAPGGFGRSAAANLGIGVLGTAIAGPVVGTALSLAHDIGYRGVSAPEAIGAAVGGQVAGGLGSIAGHAVGQQVSGKESYESQMTQADRDAKDKERAEAGTVPGQPGDPNPGASDGAGAGTAYVMAPPAAAAPTAVAAAAAPAPKDVWDEAGFLARNPEVGKAVENGTWTSGRSFNTAYKAQAGANYDSAKALGLISPYRDDMLKSRPGQAVAYRGV
jgi:hypothetical protein